MNRRDAKLPPLARMPPPGADYDPELWRRLWEPPEPDRRPDAPDDGLEPSLVKPRDGGGGLDGGGAVAIDEAEQRRD